MKLIPLTQGMFARVDDCDWDYLMQWNWRYNQGQTVRRYQNPCSIVSMNRVIAERMGLKILSKIVAPKDGNKLNLVRSNLVVVNVAGARAMSRALKTGRKTYKCQRGKWAGQTIVV